jgi:hypothetical protein
VNGSEEYAGVPLVFVDQVGRFSEQAELKKKDGESDEAYKARFITYMKEVAERGYFICNDADVIAKKSQVTTGEENSGIRFNKFPYLPDHDGLFRSQSTPEMRLAEIYYSLRSGCALRISTTPWLNVITEKEIRRKPLNYWIMCALETIPPRNGASTVM